MQKVYLTNDEAADYLRINPRTLEGKRLDGTGPRFYKAGPGRRTRVLYSLEDLEAWLEERHVKSTSEYL